MKRQDRSDLYGVKQSEQEIYNQGARNRKGAFNRSGYYHRYFEGYSEYYEEVPGKGRRIRRVYTAPWKAQEGEHGRRYLQKTLFGAFLSISILCFILAGTRCTRSNSVWYVSVLQFIVVVLLLLTGGSYFFYMISPRRMTLYQWKSTSGLIKTLSLFTAIGMGLLATAVVCFLFSSLAGSIGAELVNIILYLFGMGTMLAIFLVEGKTVYIDIPNDTELPQSGTMIR